MTPLPAAHSGVQDSERLLTIGRIAGLFGVRGWVKVFSYTRPREGILNYDTWWLSRPGGPVSYRLAEGRPHGEGIVARLDGIDDRDQATDLVGSEIAIRLSQLPPTAAGEYYWTQLEGLRVVNLVGEELGHVSGLFETGANDVMVVKATGDGSGARKSNERLIPYVTRVVREVDLEHGVITVDWHVDD